MRAGRNQTRTSIFLPSGLEKAVDDGLFEYVPCFLNHIPFGEKHEERFFVGYWRDARYNRHLDAVELTLDAVKWDDMFKYRGTSIVARAEVKHRIELGEEGNNHPMIFYGDLQNIDSVDLVDRPNLGTFMLCYLSPLQAYRHRVMAAFARWRHRREMERRERIAARSEARPEPETQSEPVTEPVTASIE